MEEKIQNLKNTALAQIMGIKAREELEALRINYLGRQGEINKLLDEVPKIPTSKRAVVGQLLNDAKTAIEKAIFAQQEKILQKTGAGEWFDVTAPGTPPKAGYLHPQTKVIREILAVFKSLGYQVADGPTIETDYYNFEFLNIPADHPARDQQQTLWLSPNKILRTQTSSMQGRIMEKTKPPLRVVVPGKCFRYENADATHGFEFWQIEGFLVDKNVGFTDLLGTLEFVLRKLFGSDIKMRFSTTYFPFVEPGVEAHITCTVCGGKGCGFCKRTGWVEIIGAGMIHPDVLARAKLNPKTWQGFAFGLGLSRVTTLKYQMDDLRLLTTPDLRIIRQF